MMISTELLATVTLLDGDGALRLISAILAYDNDQEPELTGKEALLWPLIKCKMDEQKRQEAAIRQRQEAGQASARKRWCNESVNEPCNEKGNEPYNEPCNETCNETGNETCNETGNEMGNETGNETYNETYNETGNELGNEIGIGMSLVTTEANPVGSVSINNIYNTTTPITTLEREKEKIKKEKKRESGAGFDLFWQAYPRKQSKADAVKAWDKLRPDDKLLDVILFALEWQTNSDEWRRENGKFIPYPATYLNGRRWEDEPPRKQPPSFRYAPQNKRAQQFVKLEAEALEPL